MDTKKFVYAGTPEPGYGPWTFIEDSPESRAQALVQGCKAFTTVSFAYEPKKDKPEPMRYGDLWLDIDCKEAPFLAIVGARDFVKGLLNQYDGFDPALLEYYMSGSKGVHIRIPAEVFGGENGHPCLPKLHLKMLERIFQHSPIGRNLGLLALGKPVPDDFRRKTVGDLVDTSLYCMGKGKLLRAPNIRRPDGCYKVQVSVEEFFEWEINSLLELTQSARTCVIQTPPPTVTGMTALYDHALLDLQSCSQRKLNLQGLSDCQFMRHCRENAAALSEPEWFLMLRILAQLGEKGLELAQEYSRPHPEYSAQKTQAKFLHALSKGYSVNCSDIQEFFQCSTSCKVRSPLDLERKRLSDAVVAAESFSSQKDGLYYSPSRGTVEGDSFKVCSPLKVLGKMRNTDGTGWARLVKLLTPDGKEQKLTITMKECVGRGDVVLGRLCEHGLELSGGRMEKFIMEYLRLAGSDKIFTNVERLGWHGKCYVLPDNIFGGGENEEIHYTQEHGLFNHAGELEQWHEHVGRYCQGNTLLMLVVAFALTGPLLRPCEMEGGGLHLFGPSSTGKTTLALLAGSLCGGNDSKGFIRQWRSTHNALEHIAAQHNDCLLVLDEIGQATAETVTQVTYMLPNGQGKERMRSDATQRKAHQWLLNFFSTGELSIEDKIEETGKYRAMAGQNVRVINLPIDGGTGKNVYSTLHGFKNPAALSEHLKNASRTYYGTPLRAFLKVLCGAGGHDLHMNLDEINDNIVMFTKKHCPEGACGQVRRVVLKFGLTAAAGVFAAKAGILPWTPEESSDAVVEWLNVWLDERGGVGNLEIMKALDRFKDFFARYSRSRFVDVDGLGESMRDLAGYRWEDKGDLRLFMTIPTFNDLAKGVNRHELLEHMKRQRWLLMNTKGNPTETKCIKGRNVRGYGFIPSAWEGRGDLEERHMSVAKDSKASDCDF